ncbi:MAG: hypothetical protein ACUVV4_07680 [Candidatus Bathyarchaeia archaeon]
MNSLSMREFSFNVETGILYSSDRSLIWEVIVRLSRAILDRMRI